MSTWIRCGVAHVYDGRLTNTFYGINAMGDELVVAELHDHADNIVVARIPLEAPEAVPDLERLVERRIIDNVNRDIEGS